MITAYPELRYYGKNYFKKRRLSRAGRWPLFFLSSTSSRAGLIGIFLTDSYYGTRTREWLQDETRKETGSEMVDLDKKGDFIVFSSPYDESEPKFEFSVTHETFSKILDEWEQVISEAKEYIVIEVSDDNDVHIYGMNQMKD